MNKVNLSILRQYMFESPEATIEETDKSSFPHYQYCGVLQDQKKTDHNHSRIVMSNILNKPKESCWASNSTY